MAVSKGLLAAAAATAIGAGSGAIALSSAQASSGAPRHITIQTAGVGSYGFDRFFKETLRYTKHSYTIASGGTITFMKGLGDKTSDPHTITVVTPRQLPKTVDAIESCLGGTPGTGCAIGQSAKGPVLDVGTPGLSQPGDSFALFPSKTGKYTPMTIKVTALPGTKLDFMCALHPWMEAVLHVK